MQIQNTNHVFFHILSILKHDNMTKETEPCGLPLLPNMIRGKMMSKLLQTIESICL